MRIDQEQCHRFVPHYRSMLGAFSGGDADAISLLVGDYAIGEVDLQGPGQHETKVLPAAPLSFSKPRGELKQAYRS